MEIIMRLFKKYNLFFLLLNCWHINANTQSMRDEIKLCQTHEPCVINKNCSCTIAATSAYGRYFYFDFSPIKKGKIYRCSFFGTIEFFAEYKSSFPAGSTYKCLGASCEKINSFPYSIELNTENLEKENDLLIIGSFVSASDTSDRVSFKCEEFL